MVRLATTKLSSKGQVVIPEGIRERLGLEAGVQFVVVGEGDVVVLKVLKAPRMADFKARLDKAQHLAVARKGSESPPTLRHSPVGRVHPVESWQGSF